MKRQAIFTGSTCKCWFKKHTLKHTHTHVTVTVNPAPPVQVWILAQGNRKPVEANVHKYTLLLVKLQQVSPALSIGQSSPIAHGTNNWSVE